MPRDHSLPSLTSLSGGSLSNGNSRPSSPRELHLSAIGGGINGHSNGGGGAGSTSHSVTTAPGPAAVAHSKALDAQMQLHHNAPSTTPAFLTHGVPPPRDAKRARTSTADYAGGAGRGAGAAGGAEEGERKPSPPQSQLPLGVPPMSNTTCLPESVQARYE
jgi:hypothetical protein